MTQQWNPGLNQRRLTRVHLDPGEVQDCQPDDGNGTQAEHNGGRDGHDCVDVWTDSQLSTANASVSVKMSDNGNNR